MISQVPFLQCVNSLLPQQGHVREACVMTVAWWNSLGLWLCATSSLNYGGVLKLGFRAVISPFQKRDSDKEQAGG